MTLDEIAYELMKDFLTHELMHDYDGHSILSPTSFNSFKKHKNYPYNKQFYDRAIKILRKDKLKYIIDERY